jgi:hypothetical protein
MVMNNMAIDVRVIPRKEDRESFEMMKDEIYKEFMYIHMKTHAENGEFNISIKNYIEWHPLMWMEKKKYFFIFGHFDYNHAVATRKDLRKAANKFGFKVRIEIS